MNEEREGTGSSVTITRAEFFENLSKLKKYDNQSHEKYEKACGDKICVGAPEKDQLLIEILKKAIKMQPGGGRTPWSLKSLERHPDGTWSCQIEFSIKADPASGTGKFEAEALLSAYVNAWRSFTNLPNAVCSV